MSSTGALAGLRVVDLTDLRGALCGRLLADLGADVIKVRPPGESAETVTTIAYRYRNANKRGAVADLLTSAGRSRFGGLLADADVLVENLGGRRAELGLDPSRVAATHPHLVHVALTDLGLNGRRAGWHLEPLPALAASGALYASGFPDLPPCNSPGFLAHDCASVHGAIGAIAAFLDQERSGIGQVVEVSAQEAALAGTTPWSIAMGSYLHVNPRLPVAGTRNADGSYWVLPAKDGWVRAVVGTPRQWDGFVALLGNPEELSGPEWHQAGMRTENVDVIRLVAGDRLTDRSRAELFEQALGLGATLGVLHTPAEFAAHEQTRARDFFAVTGFAGLDGAPFASAPFRMSTTPPTLRRPAPPVGEETGGFTALARHEPTGDDGLLLDGVRVVEFGVAAVGPELCWVLSELGADVVKIESEVKPDVLRLTGAGRLNCGFAFNTECRGRRSVALDLTTERAKQLAFELCRTADIVVENQRGGVLDRYGLSYEALEAVNPALVYVASQGYGRGGPYGEMPAYGPLNAGFSGVHLLWNHNEVPYPCGTSLNHPDHIAGKLLAVGTLAAWRHAERTGEGQLLDMAQTEAAAYLIGEVYLEDALLGPRTARGNSHPDHGPHGVYPAVEPDSWLAIAVSDDAAWARFSAATGISGPTTAADRVLQRSELDARVGEWTRQRSAADGAAFLQAQGVSAMPVMGPLDHHADAHLADRGAIVSIVHPEVGPELQIGNPTRFSRLTQRVAASAPCLGADTESVLAELGLDGAAVAELRAQGVCR